VLNVHIIFRKFPYLYVMYQLIWLEFDTLFEALYLLQTVAYPEILFGGVQQIQMRTEDRENGDLGAVAP